MKRWNGIKETQNKENEHVRHLKLSDGETRRLLQKVIKTSENYYDGNVISSKNPKKRKRGLESNDIPKKAGNIIPLQPQNTVLNDMDFNILNSTPTKIQRTDYPRKYVHYDDGEDVIFDSAFSTVPQPVVLKQKTKLSSFKDLERKLKEEMDTKHPSKRRDGSTINVYADEADNKKSDTKVISITGLYQAILNTKGMPLSECYPIFNEILNINRRRTDYDRKSIMNNINYKIRTLVPIYPHLRYYGTQKNFNLEKLRRFPEILIRIQDEQLRDEFQSYDNTKRIARGY